MLAIRSGLEDVEDVDQGEENQGTEKGAGLSRGGTPEQATTSYSVCFSQLLRHRRPEIGE